MSTDLKPASYRNGTLLMTRFFGGAVDGQCVQLTAVDALGSPDKSGYVQLNKAAALELAVALVEFANGTRDEVAVHPNFDSRADELRDHAEDMRGDY